MAAIRRQTIIEGSIVAAIVAVIAYIAVPPGPSFAERRKLDQMVGPIDVENVEAAAVLQQVVNQLRVSVPIALCRDLATKRITMKVPEAVRLRDFIRQIAGELGADVRLFSGLHGEGAAALRLQCTSSFGADMIIEKNDG